MKNQNNYRRSMTRVRGLMGGAVLGLALGVMAATAQATVITIARYNLGEDDPGATANQLGQNPTLDSSGNGLNLTQAGAPTNRTDTARAESTLSMQFSHTPAGAGYFLNAPVSNMRTNVGVELWAKPLAVPGGTGEVLMHNGTASGGDGYFLYLTPETTWKVGLGGVGLVAESSSATLSQWVHLAMVFTESPGAPTLVDMQFYKNGVLDYSATQLWTVAPTGQFSIGGYSATSDFGFNGLIDQVRVFEFTGAFDPSDLLYSVPEPSVVGLLMMGGVLLYRQRRRS